ncbi:MAG: hypothetical protein Q9195_007674 [Heterodermia aff. obscurata]
MLRVQAILRTQSASRLVGANSPGMISSIGKCRIGFHPLPTFSPGCIGIVAKSGTLSYETVASTTRAGLGQTLVVGIGGDMLPGTDFVDVLRILEHDEDTMGIILIGEIGGKAEEDAAEPIMALVAGMQAKSGRIMGHAGAFVGPAEMDALAKARALEKAGVILTDHPSKFGDHMRRLLGSNADRTVTSRTKTQGVQRRAFHTDRIPFRSRLPSFKYSGQMRNLTLSSEHGLHLLSGHGVPVSSIASKQTKLETKYFMSIFVDRANYQPCVIFSRAYDHRDPYVHEHRCLLGWPSRVNHDTKSLESATNLVEKHFNAQKASLFAYIAGIITPKASNQAEDLNISSDQYRSVVERVLEVFYETDAILLETTFSIQSEAGRDGSSIIAVDAHVVLDDAAYKSRGRQKDIYERMMTNSTDDEAALLASKDGITYIRLEGEGSIGSLVNGAGLAMNTNDAIANLGGMCANFLDTGGKATSETVKTSFNIVLKDARVKVVFVNIFGGLTLCDMIAEGIMLAYKELGIRVPVVVRLRGTNEEMGQKMIAESGLPLYAFDDFEEAAEKAIELSQIDRPQI